MSRVRLYFAGRRFAEKTYKSTRPPGIAGLARAFKTSPARGGFWPKGLQSQVNEPANLQGMVFAAAQCVGRDEAGTLRAAAPI